MKIREMILTHSFFIIYNTLLFSLILINLMGNSILNPEKLVKPHFSPQQLKVMERNQTKS